MYIKNENIDSTITNFIQGVKQMFTVYMKDNSTIYYSGFKTWQEANKWGKAMFGPGGYEIEQEW